MTEVRADLLLDDEEIKALHEFHHECVKKYGDGYTISMALTLVCSLDLKSRIEICKSFMERK